MDEVHRHDSLLKSWLKGTFPAIRDVDDVVQESYLRIWQARARQPIQSAKAFLFRVARNLALDNLRRNRNAPFEFGRDCAASGVIDTAPNAAESLITQDILHHLAAALVSLRDGEREVIVMHKLQGLPQKEVAVRLGLSDRTVEKYCLRGMRRCAEFLAARGIDGFFE